MDVNEGSNQGSVHRPDVRVKITIWADLHEIERMAKSGKLSLSRSERIWMSTVRDVIKGGGFDLAIETTPGLGVHGDWDLMIGPYALRSCRRMARPLDYQGLATALLGDCQCNDGPCGCYEHGRQILVGLLPIIVRNAESTVEYALERGAYAVDDASFRALRAAELGKGGS